MGVQEVESLGNIQRDVVAVAVPLQLPVGVALDRGAQVPPCSHSCERESAVWQLGSAAALQTVHAQLYNSSTARLCSTAGLIHSG